jgi:type I restriction enzyme S subunit
VEENLQKFQEILNELKVGTSDSSVSIGNKQVLDLEIPVPSIEDQKIIIEILEERISFSNRLRESVTTQLDRSTYLKRLLLHAAFSGYLAKESNNV